MRRTDIDIATRACANQTTIVRTVRTAIHYEGLCNKTKLLYSSAAQISTTLAALATPVPGEAQACSDMPVSVWSAGSIENKHRAYKQIELQIWLGSPKRGKRLYVWDPNG